MFCSKCGAENADGVVTCNSCGASTGANLALPNTTMSVVALVLAFVFPLAGIITASMAQREIKASNGTKGGANLAKTAMLLSVIFLALEVIFVTVWAISFFSAMSAADDALNDLQNQLDDMEVPDMCWDSDLEEFYEC